LQLPKNTAATLVECRTSRLLVASKRLQFHSINVALAAMGSRSDGLSQQAKYCVAFAPSKKIAGALGERRILRLLFPSKRLQEASSRSRRAHNIAVALGEQTVAAALGKQRIGVAHATKIEVALAASIAATFAGSRRSQVPLLSAEYCGCPPGSQLPSAMKRLAAALAASRISLSKQAKNLRSLSLSAEYGGCFRQAKGKAALAASKNIKVAFVEPRTSPLPSASNWPSRSRQPNSRSRPRSDDRSLSRREQIRS
jgi:hypothetical protein